MPTPGDPTHRRALALLGAGLALGLVARLVFGLGQDGLLWPDEYYQSLEPAHRLVFGYGWQAWEFLEGARHWTLPGFVAAVMKAASVVGLDYLLAVRVVFCLAGTATAFAVFRLARALGATERSSAVAATVFSLMGLTIYVASRAMGETLSALPITLAVAQLCPPSPRGGEGRGEGKPTHVILAGLLLSLAVALRLQNGLFCLFALAWLLLQRRRRGTLLLLGTLFLGALLYGAVDWFTWGRPFHSALTYLRFNLLEGRSSAFGTHSPLLYLQALVTSEALTIVPLVVLSALAWKQHRAVPLMALGFVLVHSLIPHKELRFIFPALPLLAAHAALGLDALSPGRARLAVPALLGVALLSMLTLSTLTFGRLGIHNPPPELSAIDYGGPENRLLLKAGRLDDLCGLHISSIAWWRTGGFAYLHKRVPMYPPRPGDGHFNYVIARRGEATGTEVAADGDVVLLKVADGCTPDDSYDWHLE